MNRCHSLCHFKKLFCFRDVGKSSCSLLMSHGGELWMHAMETTRSVLEDPPSISEGSGGRVTDYRITVSSTSVSGEYVVQLADFG